MVSHEAQQVVDDDGEADVVALVLVHGYMQHQAVTVELSRGHAHVVVDGPHASQPVVGLGGARLQYQLPDRRLFVSMFLEYNLRPDPCPIIPLHRAEYVHWIVNNILDVPLDLLDSDAVY